MNLKRDGLAFNFQFINYKLTPANISPIYELQSELR